MREAAKRFEFEKAAKLRDTIKELRAKEFVRVSFPRRLLEVNPDKQSSNSTKIAFE